MPFLRLLVCLSVCVCVRVRVRVCVCVCVCVWFETALQFQIIQDTNRQQLWWILPDTVNTVTCSWWWTKTSPETCRAHSFYLAVCLTTRPKPLPLRALHIVRSRAFSFKWEYPLLSLRSSNSFLRLLPCLPVTSIPPLYLSFNNPL
jgi:hypothetical protein